MLTSKIQQVGGAPSLTVNGKPIPQIAYITYLTDNNRYSDFVKAGYNLFSIAIFFSKKPINETTPDFEAFSDGIFESNPPDFSIFDREMERILSICPNAYVFPRVNVNVTDKWEDANKNELNDEGYLIKKLACFSSDAWAREVENNLTAFINYVENSKYRDNVVGYQIAGGNTEEWFPFDYKGSDGLRSREMFVKRYNRNPLGETDDLYYRFLSDIVAERISQFASLTKKITNRRVVVGTFYGYTLNASHKTSCHHALDKILKCDDIDFICSPVPYDFVRPVEYDHGCMVPVDTLKLHNKLYFVENDTRTHLSKAPVDIPKFDHPIWYGPKKELSLEVIKMHFARALTHGHAMWWFDMWGGWYDDPDYMSLLSKIYRISEDAVLLNKTSRAETAVFIDEKSYSYIDKYTPNLAMKVLKNLGISGFLYDAYLIDDFDKVKDKYKAFVFIVPFATDKVKNAINSLADNKLVIYQDSAENIYSVDTFRLFAKKFGVKIYTDKPSAVYLNESFAFIHAYLDEVIDFNVFNDYDSTDLFSGKKYIFPCSLKKGQSLLFKRKKDR